MAFMAATVDGVVTGQPSVLSPNPVVAGPPQIGILVHGPDPMSSKRAFFLREGNILIVEQMH
jgi:hypothetical protein